MARLRSIIAGCALLTVAACNAGANAGAPQEEQSAAAAGDDDAEFDADWPAPVAALGPETTARLPSPAAIGERWEFAEVVTGEARPVDYDSTCQRDVPEQPAWVLVRFVPNLERVDDGFPDGTLDIRLYDAESSGTVSFVEDEGRVDCLRLGLPEGTSLTEITDSLPDGAATAFRIDYDPLPGDSPEDPMQLREFTVAYVRGATTTSQVLVSSIQPADHPDPFDTTTEALRIAAELAARG